ncbi:MAG: response regulator, partial [bacterium]
MNKNVMNGKKKTSSKILIVEDEMIVAKDMQETLKARGYTVTAIVNSGRDAIEMVKKEKPDLVLMDIVLKGKIDGIDTAGRIRTKFDIPIIFITAFTNSNLLEKAKAAEPYAFITKPFEGSELFTNIEIAICKHKITQELTESEQRLKILFEFAPDAYYLNDLKGSFVDGNKAAEELTGYT